MSTFSSRVCVALMIAAGISSAGAAERMRMINEADVAKDWAPAAGKTLAPAGYPAGTDRSQDVCVSLGYQIGKDGKTSQFAVLNAWSSKEPGISPSSEALTPFVQSAAFAVSQWSYTAATPASTRRESYTVATMAFVGSRAGAADEVRSHCEIADLSAFIAREQAKAFKRGGIEREKLDRYQRENTPQQEAVRQAARRAGGG